MRVLEVAPPWFAVPPDGYGGIEEVVALLADGLAERGHDVTLAASGGSRTRAKLESAFAEPPSEEIGDIWHEAIHVLQAYLRHADADVVHDHTGTIGPALGAVTDGPPVVHTLHGPWTTQVERFHRLVGPRLSLVAISHDQADRAPAGIPIRAVVPNGIDLAKFPPRLERRGSDAYLAFVGRANREKGPEVAVQVAKRLGRPLRMLVKVNEPPEEQYWRDVVAPHLTDADVELANGLDRAGQAELMAGADATLCPAQWPEPFGLVAVESMACGTPVVAYADGAMRETIVHGETGLLAAPGDFDTLCELVRHVDEIDPADCRRRVEEQYAAPVMVDRYVQLFHDVVNAS